MQLREIDSQLGERNVVQLTHSQALDEKLESAFQTELGTNSEHIMHLIFVVINNIIVLCVLSR